MRARTNSRQDPGSRMFAESRWPERRGNRVTEGGGGAEVDADPLRNQPAASRPSPAARVSEGDFRFRRAEREHPAREPRAFVHRQKELVGTDLQLQRAALLSAYVPDRARQRSR